MGGIVSIDNDEQFIKEFDEYLTTEEKLYNFDLLKEGTINSLGSLFEKYYILKSFRLGPHRIIVERKSDNTEITKILHKEDYKIFVVFKHFNLIDDYEIFWSSFEVPDYSFYETDIESVDNSNLWTEFIKGTYKNVPYLPPPKTKELYLAKYYAWVQQQYQTTKKEKVRKYKAFLRDNSGWFFTALDSHSINEKQYNYFKNMGFASDDNLNLMSYLKLKKSVANQESPIIFRKNVSEEEYNRYSDEWFEFFRGRGDIPEKLPSEITLSAELQDAVKPQQGVKPKRGVIVLSYTKFYKPTNEDLHVSSRIISIPIFEKLYVGGYLPDNTYIPGSYYDDKQTIHQSIPKPQRRQYEGTPGRPKREVRDVSLPTLKPRQSSAQLQKESPPYPFSPEYESPVKYTPPKELSPPPLPPRPKPLSKKEVLPKYTPPKEAAPQKYISPPPKPAPKKVPKKYISPPKESTPPLILESRPKSLREIIEQPSNREYGVQCRGNKTYYTYKGKIVSKKHRDDYISKDERYMKNDYTYKCVGDNVFYYKNGVRIDEDNVPFKFLVSQKSKNIKRTVKTSPGSPRKTVSRKYKIVGEYAYRKSRSVEYFFKVKYVDNKRVLKRVARGSIPIDILSRLLS